MMFAGAAASYTEVEQLDKDDEEELEKSTGIQDIDEAVERIVGSLIYLSSIYKRFRKYDLLRNLGWK